MGSGDDAVLRLAVEGDRDALTTLYERHFAATFDFLARLLRDPDPADALARAAFARAFEQLGDVAAPDDLDTWFLEHAHRAAERAESPRGSGAPVTGAEATLAHPGDPQRDDGAAAWAAAAALDPARYAALDLHLRRGLDTAGAARVMGIAPAEVGAMLEGLEDEVAPEDAAAFAALAPLPVPAGLDRVMRQLIAARAAAAAIAAGDAFVPGAPVAVRLRPPRSQGWATKVLAAAILALVVAVFASGDDGREGHIVAAGLAPADEDAPQVDLPASDGTAAPAPVESLPPTTFGSPLDQPPSSTGAPPPPSTTASPPPTSTTVPPPPPSTTVAPPPTSTTVAPPPPTTTAPPPPSTTVAPPPPTTTAPPPPPTTTTTAPPPPTTLPPAIPQVSILAPLVVPPPLLCTLPVVVSAEVLNPGLAAVTVRADYQFRSGGAVTSTGSRSMQSSLAVIPGAFSFPVDLDGKGEGRLDVTLTAVAGGVEAASTSVGNVAVSCLG